MAQGRQLDDADDLPEPEELATDAISELKEAIGELNEVLKLLGDGNGDGGERKRGDEGDA